MFASESKPKVCHRGPMTPVTILAPTVLIKTAWIMQCSKAGCANVPYVRFVDIWLVLYVLVCHTANIIFTLLPFWNCIFKPHNWCSENEKNERVTR